MPEPADADESPDRCGGDIEWGEMVEELARLEHRQWWEWSKSLADDEDLSEERIERWRDYWKPYDELPEDVKEHDRKWAKRAFEIVYGRVENRSVDTDTDRIEASDE